MKKVVLSVVAALALSAAPAFAADMPAKAAPAAPAAAPSPWDIAFGSALMNDYMFRGITQSGHNPSVAAYFEPRYNINSNWQLYAGISGESIKFANDAAAEIDFYGGVRPTFGPVALDFGIWEYYYPGGTNNYVINSVPGVYGSISDQSFYEVYGHATWTVNDIIAIGANVYYTPSWLATGAPGTYFSGTAKLTAPSSMLPAGIGAYLSGELGRQDLGSVKAIPNVYTISQAGTSLPSYTTWNVGLGFTWKVFTLDLRYTDTDLSKSDCFILTGDPGAGLGGTTSVLNPTPALQSNWCGSTFIAKLSADLTLGSLK
jgi:uncharacterized protein (TIGR02001 family)